MDLSLCKSLFSSGSYVLVITSRKDAGSYQGSPAYHVNSMKFLCCNEAIKHLTPQEVCKHYHIVCNFSHIAWSQPIAFLWSLVAAFKFSTSICLQRRDEAYFMSLLRIAETTCGLYYSYDRDLTLK